MVETPTRLIIARHGATFEPGEPSRRVGLRTDLPLSSVGRAQAESLGQYFGQHGIIPSVVYTSCLTRTIETAKLALAAMGVSRPVHQNDWFNEIDYGPDENQVEDLVKQRLGQDALDAWETMNVPPPGWLVLPVDVIEKWRLFAFTLTRQYQGQTTLVVTSNGIARFAPDLAVNGREFTATSGRKLSCGAFSVFQFAPRLNAWVLGAWNVKPTATDAPAQKIA